MSHVWVTVLLVVLFGAKQRKQTFPGKSKPGREASNLQRLRAVFFVSPFLGGHSNSVAPGPTPTEPSCGPQVES